MSKDIIIPNQIQLSQNDINDAKLLVCDKCGHDTFVPRIKVKKISGILLGTMTDELMPIDYLVCEKCNSLSPMDEDNEMLKKLIQFK